MGKWKKLGIGGLGIVVTLSILFFFTGKEKKEYQWGKVLLVS